MSKKNFSTAGMDILGLRQPEEEKAANNVAFIEPSPNEPMATLVVPTPPTQLKKTFPETKVQPLVRRSYYVTPSQHKALKIKAANAEAQEEKDISTIIRNAIDMYLAKNM